MDVGVRELKQRLSEILRLVEGGETVRVTDRGVPKATITPIVGTDQLTVGVEEGWIRPPVHRRPIGASAPVRSERRVMDLLREDRGE